MKSRMCLFNSVTLIILCAVGIAKSDAQPPRAAVVPEGATVERNIEYVPTGHERQRLDLYRPAKAEKPLPVIVWIHGGAFRMGSKDQGSPALSFVLKGYAVASINYRLSQHALFPAQIEDCKSAVRFLRANASKYNLNPDRIAVWGASAGGNLAALVGTTGDSMDFDKGEKNLTSSRVQAVVDFFGPTDFTKMGGDHDSPDSPESALIGGPIQENKAKAARANPIAFVTKSDPPFLIVHGSSDPMVPYSQSVLLAESLKKAGVPVIFHTIEGAGHGGPQFDSPENLKRVEEFLAKYLLR